MGARLRGDAGAGEEDKRDGPREVRARAHVDEGARAEGGGVERGHGVVDLHRRARLGLRGERRALGHGIAKVRDEPAVEHDHAGRAECCERVHASGRWAAGGAERSLARRSV